jgi:hypothetical protein
VIFQQRNSKKNSDWNLWNQTTELEFRFQWGSQKFDQKVGIPNQACTHRSGIISAAAASMDAAR